MLCHTNARCFVVSIFYQLLAQLVKHLRFEQIFENLISVDCVGAMSPIFNHLLELRLWAWRIS